MNADGSNQTRLTFNAENDYNPAWSPDGRGIAFVSWRDGNAEIYIMNPDGTEQTRLTFNTNYDDFPDWGPIPAPIANFTANVTSGTAPFTVLFNDLSTNNPTGWAWYFGDENYTAPWTQVTVGDGMSVRHTHSTVVMPDGSIILMGGYVGFPQGNSLNDVWRSTDNGATWTQMTANAGWSARARS